ncbi:agarase [Thermostilla marina]
MPRSYNRRDLLKGSLSLAAGLLTGAASRSSIAATKTKTTQPSPEGFFTIGIQKTHWWFLTPDGRPFFSLGLNHIDPATLRYPENIHLWEDRYGGDIFRWLRESVAPNLQAWGFNTVGWVQEVTVRQWRHSRSFTLQEYQAIGMPYCHMLPFTESHQWEKHTRHYDYRSSDWTEWCDYVARAHCAEFRNDPNLIGYFYSDCPCWVHDRPANAWRGPIFDPELLQTESGRRELRDLAAHYYKTTHDAIRRYDPHHLILGDRYEANAPLPVEIIESAIPYVDVLSFQDFRDPVSHLADWHEKTGKPVLLADAARINWQTNPGEYTRNDGRWYAQTLSRLFETPGCVGFHLCGAYQRNRARRYGLLDEQENLDSENVSLIRQANEEIARRMDELFAPRDKG